MTSNHLDKKREKRKGNHTRARHLRGFVLNIIKDGAAIRAFGRDLLRVPAQGVPATGCLASTRGHRIPGMITRSSSFQIKDDKLTLFVIFSAMKYYTCNRKLLRLRVSTCFLSVALKFPFQHQLQTD